MGRRCVTRRTGSRYPSLLQDPLPQIASRVRRPSAPGYLIYIIFFISIDFRFEGTLVAVWSALQVGRQVPDTKRLTGRTTKLKPSTKWFATC